jgi:myosin heavy subunit
VWPPSDHNNDTYNQDTRQEPTVASSIPQRLDSPLHPSSKRKQHFEDGGASKRAHIELADATEGGPGSSTTGYPTRWTYEEFALRYYMLVPSSSRTSDTRDMANRILMRVLGASKSEGLDKYQIGLTEISFHADMLAFLENLRTTRLNHCATVIQKNLKAKYYRRKYLEARNAILLIQSVTRRHLAWKYTQETCKIKAATIIQRIWRGQKQRKRLNAIRNSVVLIQAAAKGLLRRREIMDTRFGKAAVLIQRVWRLRRHMKSWRQYRRKVVIVQSLWRGKCARRRCEKIREAEASSDAVGQEDHGNGRLAELPAHWRTQLQRIKSIEVLEDCQRFCHMVRHPVTSIDIRPDLDALERSGGLDKIPTRYRRLKQVKFILEDGWEKEKSLDVPKIVLQVSRRIHLVELTARYMEDTEAEKAASEKRRTEAKKTAFKKRRQPSAKKKHQPTVRETYVDLLFPHTIEYKDQKAQKGKKGKKVKKGKQMSDQKGQQVSGADVREKAEKRFDYFIRLGKPLWKMSECYGLSVLAILPKEVTEAR